MRLRFRTWTLLAVVALTAVALATPGEIRTRRQRRHYARIAACYRDHIAFHQRRRSECEAAGRRPYDPESGQDARRDAGVVYDMPTFDGWAAEAGWHARKAEELNADAAHYVDRERSLRRRLLFPVIFDIRRPGR